MIKLHKNFTLIELANLLEVELKLIANSASDVNQIIDNNTINTSKLYVDLNNHQILASNFIDSVATIDIATYKQVTFLANPAYVKYLPTTNAAAVILEPKYLHKCNTVALVTKNPRLALAKLLNLCINKPMPANIHASCVLGNNVKIGNHVTIEPGVIIGNNCIIGNNTIIKANVVLYDQVTIGNNCIIHSNSVIGSDGFGYAQDDLGRWVKMPHLGGVIIEDQVEIGSNTSIDRGCIDNTIIKSGVIIDNLVQIAHNVIIGEHTAIAGCTVIAGSTIIGKHCLIGGATSIGGHLVIGDYVCITATSAVNKSLPKKGIYSSGLNIKDNLTWKKNVARFNCLDETLRKILAKLKT